MTLCYTEEELLELKGTSLYRATKIQVRLKSEEVNFLRDAYGCSQREVDPPVCKPSILSKDWTP